MIRTTPGVACRIAILTLLGLLGRAGFANASTFDVNPIRVFLAPGTSTALMTVSNGASAPLRFQVSAFEWSQAPDGEMKLTPTRDLVVFPTLLVARGNEQMKVRIGYTGPRGEKEKTYRVFFQELPDASTQEAAGAQVRIVTRMGIPVFVQPQKSTQIARVDGLAVDKSNLKFNVVNDGNSHYLVNKVGVTIADAAGKSIFQRQIDGWYVLAGGTRTYDLPLPPEVCAQMAKADVTVETDLTPAEASTVKQSATLKCQ